MIASGAGRSSSHRCSVSRSTTCSLPSRQRSAGCSLGRIIAGIMGASFTTASAYIADVSTPENRAQNFGMIGAMLRAGFHHRAAARRLPRGHRPARAVHRNRGTHRAELHLRLVLPAGVAEAGESPRLRLEARESRGHVDERAAVQGGCRPVPVAGTAQHRCRTPCRATGLTT